MSIISEVGRTVKEFADGSFLKSFTSAVILAAGSGTRMNSDKTKQWIQVGGVPAVVRTLAVFQASKYINEIIVCARRWHLPDILPDFLLTRLSRPFWL